MNEQVEKLIEKYNKVRRELSKIELKAWHIADKIKEFDKEFREKAQIGRTKIQELVDKYYPDHIAFIGAIANEYKIEKLNSIVEEYNKKKEELNEIIRKLKEEYEKLIYNKILEFVEEEGKNEN